MLNEGFSIPIDFPKPIVQSSIAATSPYTDQLRSRRESRARHTIKASLIAQFLSYSVRLAVIPLSLRLLGAERYGLWLTVGSLVTWLTMAEFGLSRGMVNAIAEATGRNDARELRSLVSTGCLCFSVISLLSVFVVIPASSSADVLWLIGAGSDGPLAEDARLLVLVCGLFAAASLSLPVVGSVCQGLQEGYVAAYFQGGATVLSLLALLGVYVVNGGLLEYAIGMSAPPLLANVVLAGWMFTARHPRLRPSLRCTNKASFRTIVGFGGPLFLAQLANIAVLYSTNILIAHALGPAEVPKYAVPNSLFMIAAGACMLIVQPYVPAIAEAAQSQDWFWIRRSASRIAVRSLGLMAVANLGLLVAGRPLIRIWAGSEVTPSWPLLVGMCIYFFILTALGTTGVILVGLGLIIPRTILHCAGAVLFVGIAWALARDVGIIAIPIAGSAAFLWVVLVWVVIAVRHISRCSARARFRS